VSILLTITPLRDVHDAELDRKTSEFLLPGNSMNAGQIPSAAHTAGLAYLRLGRIDKAKLLKEFMDCFKLLHLR